jgi:aminoglycoside 3-N-acetyltransferase
MRNDLAITPVETMRQWWQDAGIIEGDILLLHSSIRRLMLTMRRARITVTVADVYESLRLAVGPQGTLVFPLFNFDFTTGTPFDLRSTPSQMGLLTEFARTQPLAVRTGHPVYSFSAIGAKADRFRGLDNFSAYGKDSPFALLRELDAKIGSLDLDDQNSMTFYHHVEESYGVDYRYNKTFTALYTDINGITRDRTYGIFVRDLKHGVKTHVNPAGEALWAKGLYHGARPGYDHGLRTIRAQIMYEEIWRIIASGRAQGMLYAVEPQ